MTSAVTPGASVTLFTFDDTVTAADWSLGNIEFFSGGTWHASFAIVQASPTMLNVVNTFITGTPGQQWRILTAPAGVLVPQSGVNT